MLRFICFVSIGSGSRPSSLELCAEHVKGAAGLSKGETGDLHPTLTAATFRHFYNSCLQHCVALLKGVVSGSKSQGKGSERSAHNSSTAASESGGTKLQKLRKLVVVFKTLVHATKDSDAENNFTKCAALAAVVKVGSKFVDTFISTSCFKFLDTVFNRQNIDMIVQMFKDLQQSTRWDTTEYCHITCARVVTAMPVITDAVKQAAPGRLLPRQANEDIFSHREYPQAQARNGAAPIQGAVLVPSAFPALAVMTMCVAGW